MITDNFTKSEKFTIAKCIALEVLATTGDRPQILTGLCNEIYEDLLNESPEAKEQRYDNILNNL